MIIFQKWRVEEQVLNDGMGQETVVGVSLEGTPIVKTEEHYLNRRMDRLNDKICHNLRDLGLLDSEERTPHSLGSSGIWRAESEHVSITIKETESSSFSSSSEDVDE